MNFLEITDVFKEVVQQYIDDLTVAVNYIKANNLYEKLKTDSINCDARDFVPLVAMMGITGDTKETRAQDIRNKIDELTRAFSSEDRREREPYLNMLYDLADTFDPATVDMKDPKAVGKLLQCHLMDQTTGEKKKENPEYYNKRYATKSDGAVMDSKLRFLTIVSQHVGENLNKIGVKKLPNILSSSKLPPMIPEYILNARLAFAKTRRDQAVAEKESGVPSNAYKVPVLDAMVPYAGRNIAELKQYSKEDADAMSNFFSFVLEEPLFLSENKNMQGLKEAQMTHSMDSVYIDGMPYRDFLKAHLPNEKPYDSVNSKVLSTILLNDRHNVDIVHAYRDESGTMQYEAKALKAELTPQQQEMKRKAQEEYLKQFSWVRRVLFNWGPFRILPKPEKLNSSAVANRHAKICKNMKGRVETRLAELEEEARKKRAEDAEKEAKTKEENAKFKQESKRLEESVLKWEEGSVLHTLGQQLKGSYNLIGHHIQQAGKDRKYENVFELLAKQVLYFELWEERVSSKDGEMGKIEKGLMGDGQPETIKKNIDEAVAKIAQDEVLKDVFFSKVASHGTLRPEKYRELVVNGGVQRFTKEYVAKREEVAKEKATSAMAEELEKKNELENQPKTVEQNTVAKK